MPEENPWFSAVAAGLTHNRVSLFKFMATIMRASFFGYTLIALICAAAGVVVPEQTVPHYVWLILFAVIAILANHVWRKKEMPSTTKDWLRFCAFMVLWAVAAAALTYLAFGKMTGFLGLDIVVASTLAIISLAGALRCYLLMKSGSN